MNAFPEFFLRQPTQLPARPTLGILAFQALK